MFHVYIVASAEVPHGEDADIERDALEDCADLHMVRLYDEAGFDPYAAETDAIILWPFLRIEGAVASRCSSEIAARSRRPSLAGGDAAQIYPEGAGGATPPPVV
jgi:hypothetical protein